ncbi:sterol desaturase family protein [Bradyrhizobium sp. CCBAU 51753]|uniref:sterol desaturase family protein n=1 Tax=Bradyrhizobium sp. CCBAU 51753 TaxID=1325100 RepID=UPI00188C35D7|nr:sterol desaturase family protein [Bradyrhizobium sp. CCBAU 51753]QOZ28734.1 fatty acid hydroxylase [Bradyrhizobium sp. CCBAU 51753]
MSAVDAFGLLVPVTYLVMLGIETLFPARVFPALPYWRLKGLAFLIVQGLLAALTPLLIPESWLVQHRLINLESLGVIGGAMLGYAVVSLISYAWHRSAHSFPLMWRLFHQIHHSPQRVDMSGAALFHPLETLVFLTISTVTTTLVLGLDPVAAALTGYIAAFYGYFQHMNIRTPQWLGYLIQRPEAHCIHHQRDVHAYNYGDLPIWDMLLGTFRNPASFEGEAGFDRPASDRLAAMLGFVDVNAEAAGPNSLGRGADQRA